MTFEQAAEIIAILNTISSSVTVVLQICGVMVGVILFSVVQSAFRL